MASDKTDQTSLRVCQSQGQARSATGHKALRAGVALGPGGPQGAPGSYEGPGVAVWGVSWPPGPCIPGQRVRCPLVSASLTSLWGQH